VRMHVLINLRVCMYTCVCGLFIHAYPMRKELFFINIILFPETKGGLICE